LKGRVKRTAFQCRISSVTVASPGDPAALSQRRVQAAGVSFFRLPAVNFVNFASSGLRSPKKRGGRTGDCPLVFNRNVVDQRSPTAT
jgi:hypothetical protein